MTKRKDEKEGRKGRKKKKDEKERRKRMTKRNDEKERRIRCFYQTSGIRSSII